VLRAERRMHALENGKHDPSLPLAYAIAHAFGVRVPEVFPDEGQPADGAISSQD
jgi:putative transcriptional regulator